MNSNMAFPNVRISVQELAKGVMNPAKIEEAIAKYHHNGFVILEGVIPQPDVLKLKAKMQEDADIKRKDPLLVFNQGVIKTNFSMPLPLEKEFLIESIWANKFAIAVMENLIGPRPKLAFASSNVSLPTTNTSARQAVHVDTPSPMPTAYPLCIHLSLFLDTVHPSNGSTELWPRSHLISTPQTYLPNGRGWIKPYTFTKAAKTNPPHQYTIPRGSILLRDSRTWHAGMPNLTCVHPRIMLNFNYFPQWFRTQSYITLPLDCKGIVEKWKHVDAISTAKFVKGPIDYLGQEFEKYWVLNYTQDPNETLSAVRERSDLENGRVPNSDPDVERKNWWVPKKPKSLGGRKRKFEMDEEDEDEDEEEMGRTDVNELVNDLLLNGSKDIVPCCEPRRRMGIRFN